MKVRVRRTAGIWEVVLCYGPSDSDNYFETVLDEYSTWVQAWFAALKTTHS